MRSMQDASSLDHAAKSLQEKGCKKDEREASSSGNSSSNTLKLQLQAEEREAVSLVDFPDGGLRAWLVVLGAWSVSFTTWGFINAFGVFQEYYSANQLSTLDPAQISLIGSVSLALVLACSALVGKLFDAGYARSILAAGVVFYAVSLFGLSFANSYATILIAQGLGSGIAAGLLFLPAVSSISHYFKARRATALGIMATGSSIGGIIYPIVINQSLPQIGFGWSVRVAAFITIGLLSIALLTIRSRLPPRISGAILDFGHFKNKEYSLFVAGNFCVMWGIYIPQFYMQVYALKNGVPSDLAFYSLSILNASSLFGRLIPNYLADHYGPMTILLPHCFLTGILAIVWLVAGRTSLGLIVFAVLYGFTSGAFVSMLPACIAGLTEDMSMIGIRLAMSFVVVSIAALTGAPIAGAIISKQEGAFEGAAICSGTMVLIGCIFIFLARRAVVSRTGNRWV